MSTAVDRRRLKPGTRRLHVATGEVWRAAEPHPLNGTPEQPDRLFIVLERQPDNRHSVTQDYWMDEQRWATPPRRPPAKEPEPEPEPQPESKPPRRQRATGPGRRVEPVPDDGEMHSGHPCPKCGSTHTQRMSASSVYCAKCGKTVRRPRKKKGPA